jgi:RNA polymerase sigma-70 factor (ECF subfamily)
MPNSNAYQMTRINRTSQLKATTIEQRIENMVEEYYPYIHRLAFSILDDLAEADDAVQETFVAAHHSLLGFRGDADPKTWLTAIALNTCRGRLRKRKIRLVLMSTLQTLHLLRESTSSPEQSAIQNESDRSIWLAVDALNDKHRIPLILRYVHELKVPEIAEILAISQGTVHSRLHYARQKLGTQLGHLNPCMELPDETSE